VYQGLLRLIDVWFKYPGSNRYVLEGFNLEVGRKELVLLTGPNGSGKTTVLLLAGGLLQPEKGDVEFNDKPLKQQLPEARRFIGLLFQNPEVMLFNPTVYDEILYVPRQLHKDRNLLDKLARDSIRLVGLPDRFLNRRVHELSYGEKKLVALASVISFNPHILLLDEPFEGLSKGARERVACVIRIFLEKGAGILLASHEAPPELIGLETRVVELGREKDSEDSIQGFSDSGCYANPADRA
jgi:cobalt/nickel transport system ATP-binding protein